MTAVALCIMGGTGLVQAQEAPQGRTRDATQDEPTTVDDIVVTGRPLREQVDRFVEAVTAPPLGRGPARWDRRVGVCIGVVNLDPAAAQAIVDRMSAVARDMGLSTGEPGCRPNVTVVASDDAVGLAADLVRRSPNAFRPPYAGSSRGSADLRRFVEADRAVRWWHVVLPVSGMTGIVAVRIPGQRAPFVMTRGGLRTDIVNRLERAHLIVDIQRAGGLSTDQLGDYLAMAALAQIDLEADTSAYDSILNLFQLGRTISGLTDWDRAYLAGLYDAELTWSEPAGQISDIADGMFRDRRPQATADTP